jgi:hypothetical protein
MGQSSAAAEGIPLTDAQSVRTYFTFALAALILEDRAAAIRQGESPALDRDPFIGRAEWDVSDLSIDVMDTSAPKTVATVTLTNFGNLKRSFWSCFVQTTSGALPMYNGTPATCAGFTDARPLTTARLFPD